MSETEEYLGAIRSARESGRGVRIDFATLPAEVDVGRLMAELNSQLPKPYQGFVNARFAAGGGIDLDFGQIKLEPTLSQRAAEVAGTVAALAGRVTQGAAEGAGQLRAGIQQAAVAGARPLAGAIQVADEEIQKSIVQPLQEYIKQIAPVEDFPRLGEDKVSEFGRSRLATRAILEAALEASPQSVEGAITAVLGGKLIGMGAGALAQRYPVLATKIEVPAAIRSKILTELNTLLYRIKKGLGIPQETGLVPFDVRQALKEGRITSAQAARLSEDVFREELLKRMLPPEAQIPAEGPPPAAAVKAAPEATPVAKEALGGPVAAQGVGGAPVASEAPLRAITGPAGLLQAPEQPPATPLEAPRPPLEVSPTPQEVSPAIQEVSKPVEIPAPKPLEEPPIEAPAAEPEPTLAEKIGQAEQPVRMPPQIAPIEPPKGKKGGFTVAGLDRKILERLRGQGLAGLDAGESIQGRIKPDQLLKFKAAGLVDEAGKLTEPAVKAMRELDRVQQMMDAGYIDLADIVDVPKPTIQRVLQGMVDRGRTNLLKLAEKGWITDGKMLFRIPEKHKALALEFAKAAGESEPPNIDHIVTAAKLAKDEIVSVIGAREPSKTYAAFLLETKGGQRIHLNAAFHKFLKDLFPEAKWYARAPDQPLRLSVGKETVAVVMPMRGDDPLYNLRTGEIVPPKQVAPLTAKTGGSKGGEASKGVYASGTPVELGGIEFVKPLQMPEIVKLAKELLGHYPTLSRRQRPETLGLFKATPFGDAYITLRPEIFADPDQAAKVLAHEVGHLIDWLPDYYLKRGNLLGHMLVLRDFLKNTFGKIEVTDKELRSELWTASTYWRPFDQELASPDFLAYRKSAKELYADSISMLLNSPGTLERLAPKFYRGFFGSLDQKPPVKEAFLQLQALLNGRNNDILSTRGQDIREMFARGEAIFAQKNAEKELASKRLWERLRQQLDDRYHPILKKIQDLEAKGEIVPEELQPKFALQELSLADNVSHLMLSRIDREVVDPIEAAGMSIEDLGEALFLTRIVRDRASIANPLGQTSQTAQQQLDFLRGSLGEERFAKLQTAADRFHELVFESVEKAVEVGTYSREVFSTRILPNKDSYSSFAVLDFLEENAYIAPSIKAQVGTLREIANPFISTLLKTVALNRLNMLQLAKNSFRDSWLEHFPNEIAKSKRIGFGPGPAVFRTQPGMGRLEILEDGKLVSYDVDPYIAKAFERTKVGDLNVIVDMLRSVNNGVFHPLYITYNPGFALAFNPIRDFKRTYKAIPGATLRKLSVEYARALPAAYRRTAGISDELVDEMVKNFALDARFGDFNFDPREDQYGEMLKRYGLVSDQKAPMARLRRTIAKPLIQALEALRFAGSMIETLPKIAGYSLRKQLGESGRELAYNTRNYTGTPNFRVKGLSTDTTNAIFMFSNIFKEGLKADMELATDPKTRGGYWFKTVKVDLLPKLFMVLAGAGILGKELKDHYDRMSEYDKTNYITIPLGRVEGGDHGWKSVYLRIPHDETGRLAAGVFWKMANLYKGKPETWSEILAFGAGQLPTVSPAIDLARTWGLYLTGRNPYDYFRGRTIIPETEFKAGGWPALKKMVRWTVNEFGLAQFATHDPSEQTTFEVTLQATPLLNRLVRVSDFGLIESDKEAVTNMERERAIHAVHRSEVARDFLRDRWLLQQRKQAGVIPSQDLRALRMMELFYAHRFKPIDQAIKRAEERGDANETKRLQNSLERAIEELDRRRRSSP